MKNGLALSIVFIGGALVGAAAGILFAPEKGSEQRRKIKEALEKRGVKLTAAEFNKLVDEIKNIGKKKATAPVEDFDVE